MILVLRRKSQFFFFFYDCRERRLYNISSGACTKTYRRVHAGKAVQISHEGWTRWPELSVLPIVDSKKNTRLGFCCGFQSEPLKLNLQRDFLNVLHFDSDAQKPAFKVISISTGKRERPSNPVTSRLAGSTASPPVTEPVEC